MTQKQFLFVSGVKLAFLDFGGNGAPILALHGHFSRGCTFAELTEALDARWRLIALDQRGHGWSDSPGDYSRETYVNDAAAAIRALNLAPVIVLGHSLGGVNAYQLAARHPELVRAMIIEDIGAVVTFDDERESLLNWPKRFPSIRAVREFLAKKGLDGDYFLESLTEYPDGWGFRFRYDHLVDSSRLLSGNWWQDWLASTCPALLLHGNKSWAVSTKQVRKMTERRPNTRLVEFKNCGHVIHDEDPEGFNKAIKDFLESL